MPKFPTFPTLYDECRTLTISDLKKWGYLNPNQIKDGVITWSRNGIKTSSISILVNMQGSKYLELSYTMNKEKEIKYRVPLVEYPSNLSSGGVHYYFVCPSVNKQCRKLYLVDTYFLHREAFKGCMYEKQKESKYYRYLDNTMGAYFRLDNLYEELYKKHRKKTYAGKPTKWYKKLMQEIKVGESQSASDIEAMFRT